MDQHAIRVCCFQKLHASSPTTCWIATGVDALSGFRLAFTWPPGLESSVPSGPQLVEELIRLIRRAKYTIDLYFYNINSSQRFVLAQVLHEAVNQRGVKLRIYCNNRSEGKKIIDTFRGQNGHISAWHWDDTSQDMSKFHIKAIVTDDRNVYLGSANMSETAMHASAECGLFGTNPDIAKQLNQYTQLLIDCGNLKVIP
jgi:phosphatidylserine/phosphatidylglycerophosphate/cardiolipin synthase-like enzyme